MDKQLTKLEKLEKEVSLKQLQIKSLLTITQAINDNVSEEGLFNMYKSFLSWEMGIQRMGLYVNDGKKWRCSSHINIDTNKILDIIPKIIGYKRLYVIKPEEREEYHDFDVIIPVFHKDHPIAYSLIGGIADKDELYNKVQFITTITNIIAVAIENKRLFRRQLEQQKYKRDMEVAMEVQRMLIPETFPKEKHFEISVIYKPHANVGGDYLDYIRFNEHKFSVCIADIAGKGVAAAILMANFQAMIQSFIYQYRDMETFIVALNQAVYRITQSDKYITFFIAEIDTRNNKLKYVNAGHYPPILVQEGKVIRLESGCPFIGAFEQLPFVQEETIHLSKDSMLLSFTDGIVELRNSEGDYFDDEHIEDFAVRHSFRSPKHFNQTLLEEIDLFKGQDDFADDIAVLTCKLNKS